MGNASTSTRSGRRGRRQAGVLAGAGILVVGLVTAPPPDVDGARTEVVAVQFATFAQPLITASTNANRQPDNTELTSAVTPYDTADDLNWQYWIEDLGSSIAAIPGILLIGVPFIALLVAGVVVSYALVAYDAIAAALGLPPRNAQANVAALKNVDSVLAPDPQGFVSDNPPILGNGIAKSARAGREKFLAATAGADLGAAVKSGSQTATSLVQQARTSVKQAAEQLRDALTPPGAEQPATAKSPISNRQLFAKSAGTASGSISGQAHKTPVRDAVVKASAHFEKGVKQFSNHVKKVAAGASAGQAGNTE